MSASVLLFRRDEGPDVRRPGSAPARSRRGDRRGAYVLGHRLFADALLRQRRRADRLEQSFVVLVVDGSHAHLTTEAWQCVLRAAAGARRDIDAVGWLEAGAVVGILMPDASRQIAQKVLRQLRRSLDQWLGEQLASSLSLRLYAHGLPGDAREGTLPPVDLLIDAFVSDRRHPAGDAAKRAFDIVAGLCLLVLSSPLMLAAWVLVKMTSPGPAVFRQVRIGRRGEPFTMFKFRSMRTDAGQGLHAEYVTWFITDSSRHERTGGEIFKLTDDPRVTPVGHWLRKTSLDELPQFWNVLRGEMSLVGPRPPLPFEVEKYQPWHRRRVLDAKPGITGLWQVNGRSRTTFDEMVRMDLAYARTRSMWMDLKIIAATPLAMFKGAS